MKVWRCGSLKEKTGPYSLHSAFLPAYLHTFTPSYLDRSAGFGKSYPRRRRTRHPTFVTRRRDAALEARAAAHPGVFFWSTVEPGQKDTPRLLLPPLHPSSPPSCIPCSRCSAGFSPSPARTARASWPRSRSRWPPAPCTSPCRWACARCWTPCSWRRTGACSMGSRSRCWACSCSRRCSALAATTCSNGSASAWWRTCGRGSTRTCTASRSAFSTSSGRARSRAASPTTSPKSRAPSRRSSRSCSRKACRSPARSR